MKKLMVLVILITTMNRFDAMDMSVAKNQKNSSTYVYCCPRVSSVPPCQECFQNRMLQNSVTEPAQPFKQSERPTHPQKMRRLP